MIKVAGICLLFVVLCPDVIAAGTNELDIAKAALRDGAWSVARRHASLVPTDEARLIILETYAHEGDWKGLLAACDAMGYPAGDGFVYYRAEAMVREGALSAASNLVAGVVVTNGAYARAMARLRAELARASGDAAKAARVLEKEGGDDIETKLMLADVWRIQAQSMAGEAATRERERGLALWKEVAWNTNASERARAVAAAGLGDVAVLRELLAAKTSEVRRFAALQLGARLLKDDKTFAEGERLVRETVRDRPDADGAREAFYALAAAYLARRDHAEAVRAYGDMLQIWPEAAKDAKLREGRGWALLGQNRWTEALDEFRTAEELADDVSRKAACATKVADVLAALGREQEATAAYRTVVMAYPKTDAAQRVAEVIRLREMEEKGRRLYQAFEFAEARHVFEELAKADPSRRERLAYYGVLCSYGAGDDEVAESAARKLSRDAVDTQVRADATHWLAKYVYNRGRWREAKTLFAAYADTQPKAPDAPMALAWSARAALADNDFKGVISNAAQLVSRYPDSPVRAVGMVAQGEALIELARFDEAVLVLDRAALVPGQSDEDRLDANLLRADALFAMGADNPARYKAALKAYAAIRAESKLSPDVELAVSFKIARTLEKLGRADDAVDAYYTQVVLAYRTGRVAGTNYEEETRATFARAAFRLADIYESRGRIRQAINMLELVRTSDVQAATEASRKIEELRKRE